MKRLLLLALTLPLLAFAAACGSGDDPGASATAPAGNGSERVTLRLGYFPNVTHVQPQVGLARGTFTELLGSNVTLEEHIAKTGTSVPLGRMGTAEEFANMACFLASDQGGYIAGTAINVDGGASPVW